MSFPHICLIAESDYASVAEIYNEYIQKGNATMEESLYDSTRIKFWIDSFSEREKMYVLKSHNQKIIGWGVIKKYSDREGYKTTCETSVYLTEDECGKGYGTMLKKHLIQVCKSLGYHHIVAKIFADNLVSINYNLKLGYEIVGTQKQIGRKAGIWKDVVILQYIIPDN